MRCITSLPLLLFGLAACAKSSPGTSGSDSATTSNTGMNGALDGGLPDAGEVVSYAMLPDTETAVSIDDMRFAPVLDKVLVPVGVTLYLLDPPTGALSEIPGFGELDAGAPDSGVTGRPGTSSAEEGLGLIFTNDRRLDLLYLVDPQTRTITSTTGLAGPPDYVRFVAPTREVWVSEPHASQIEVFALSSDTPPRARHAALISVPGGPEQLEIDHAHGQAYTHAGTNQTVTLAIDLRARTVTATIPNGCDNAKGLVLDEARQLAMVGCAEGTVTVLDLAHGGAMLAAMPTDLGVDLIAYSPTLHHLYVPSSHAAKVSIFGVSAAGALTLLGKIDTALDGHCAAADAIGHVYVCNGMASRVIIARDPFPATP